MTRNKTHISSLVIRTMIESASEAEDSFYDCVLISSPPGIPASKRQTRGTGQDTEHYALDRKGRSMRVKYKKRGSAYFVEDEKLDAKALVALVTHSIGLEDSIDFKKAPQSPEWRAAMEDEIQTLERNKT